MSMALATSASTAVVKSLAGLRTSIPTELARLARLPRPVKLTALSLSLGIALFGALAMFFQVAFTFD